MLSASTRCSAGQNLAALGHKAAELCSVLIVDVLALVDTELANLPALAVLISITIESQGYFLLINFSAVWNRVPLPLCPPPRACTLRYIL
jgi:hypothetical protein